MLSEFLTTHRQAIITNSRAKVASRSAPRATALELETGVPLFLDQLIATLRLEKAPASGKPSDRQIGLSAATHGRALQEIGFTVDQVVHDYGDICQGITDLAIELNAPITADEFRTLNRCLDEAMAEAVLAFGLQRESCLSADAAERMKFLSKELRTLVGSSMLVFQVLKGGSVGVGGSTGAVLEQNLSRMRDLLDHSFAEAPGAAAAACNGSPFPPELSRLSNSGQPLT